MACSGGMGGWEICSILRGEENARIGVLSSGLDVLILLRVLFYFIYVLLSFGGIPECVVEVWGPFTVEVFWDIPVEACLMAWRFIHHTSSCGCHNIYVCGLRSASNSGLEGRMNWLG